MAQSAKSFVQKVVDNDRDPLTRGPEPEPGREGWTRETQALLRLAEIARKASADARIAAQERAQSTPKGNSDSSPEDHTALRQLRNELEAAQATLKDSESVLAKAHLDAERARESVMRETQALIERAEQSFKAVETTRAAPVADRRDAGDQNPGRAAEQRAVAPMAAARLTAGGRLDAGALWEQFRHALVASGYLVHVLAGACLIAGAIVLYFGAAQFGPVTGAFEPSIGRPNLPPKLVPATPPKVASNQTAIVARGVNLRAYPATNSEIIGALPQGHKVTMIEKQGNWTLVKAVGGNGRSEPLVGWTSLSFLNADKDSNAKPPASASK